MGTIGCATMDRLIALPVSPRSTRWIAAVLAATGALWCMGGTPARAGEDPLPTAGIVDPSAVALQDDEGGIGLESGMGGGEPLAAEGPGDPTEPGEDAVVGKEEWALTQDRVAPPRLPPGAPPTQPPATAPKPKGPPKPPQPYKNLFYENDFSYLTKPGNEFWYCGDALKRIRCGECGWLDLGGEYRLRYQDENGFRGTAGGVLDGRDDHFLLQRTRLFANWEINPGLRFFGEAIDATSAWEDILPRGIEENRFDALNLFVDGRLWENESGEFFGRVGRQEMAYGAERLISPLDWANTRRTFDGAKLFWRGEDWNVDGFWTRPVPFFQHQFNDHEFDHPDNSQEFMGLWATNKGTPDRILDLFYLRYAEYDAPRTAIFPADFDLSTFGGRWYAKQNGWLGEFEGGYQFGEYGAESQSAGYFVIGGGREFSSKKWKPTLWVYYDWASGDRRPGDGTHGTFIQMFPLVHRYFGFMDLVARQNIEDLNFLLTASPSAKVKLTVWYHIFHLQQSRDALYNAAGFPYRISPTGVAGRDVGSELDLLYQYAFSPRVDLWFGYSTFWAGDFVKATNPPGVTGDADFFYTQFAWKF